jgi:hypothetical protein
MATFWAQVFRRCFMFSAKPFSSLGLETVEWRDETGWLMMPSVAPKGCFGPEDGNHLILDFTQGTHGQVFAASVTADLPDPRRSWSPSRTTQATRGL